MRCNFSLSVHCIGANASTAAAAAEEVTDSSLNVHSKLSYAMAIATQIPALLKCIKYLCFVVALILPETYGTAMKGEDDLNFAQAGVNYIPLHGACDLKREEKVDFILRISNKPTEAKAKNVTLEYLKYVKSKSGETCDFTRGLGCHHRVILIKEEVDVKTLILRQQADVDPDGGGIVLSGLENIERAIKDKKPLQVLSTCRCSAVDAQEFAGECLVKAGLPCKFSSLFTVRKCVQNSACVGGIDDLDTEYEGFNSWPSHYKLLKYAATRTCQCNHGFTRTSGRECLRDDGIRNQPVVITTLVSPLLVLALSHVCKIALH